MSILQSKLRLTLALLVGVLTLAAPSFAIPVSGSFSIGGSSADVGATFLNFICNAALTASCPAATGNFVVTSPVSGSFLGPPTYLGDTGFIRNLNQAIAPINQPISVPNFISFNPAGTVLPPDIRLDLTFIFTGVGGQAQCAAAPAAGQMCTPAIPALVTAANPLGLSAFTLANTQVGSSATISVAGTATRISTGEVSTFTGIFTAQFNQFYQELLQTFATGGPDAFVENSYSATFNATPVTVPEASSITLLVGGLFLVGGIVRRRM
jgi:hypothetical protein